MRIIALFRSNHHRYSITDAGIKTSEKIEYWLKYDTNFYILWHLKEVEEFTTGQVQESIAPFYTAKETRKGLKQLLKTKLIARRQQ